MDIVKSHKELCFSCELCSKCFTRKQKLEYNLVNNEKFKVVR